MLTLGRFYREYPSPCVAGLPIIYVRPAIISKFLIALCFLIASVNTKSGVAYAQDMKPEGARAELTLVALGDSLTAGYGLAPADGFTPKLESYLRPGVSERAQFYMDVEGHIDETAMMHAMEELEFYCMKDEVRVLGTYAASPDRHQKS